MSALNAPLAAGLAAIAAGAVAYVFLLPYLSGEKRAEQRRKALGQPKVSLAERGAAANRREQVAKSLKEIEAKKDKTKVTLELRLARAGLDWTRRKFYLVSAMSGVILASGIFVVSESPFIALLALFAGGLGLPSWMLKHLQKRRIAAFIEELPNAMDVVVRGLRSGIPLGDCLRMISREAKEPLKSEFRVAIEAQTLGIPMGDAILRMYERVPVTEVNFFAVVIGIQQKAGGNLSEALGNLSRVLRERKKMSGKIKAMSMEAKVSAYIIGALPFFVAFTTYLSSPDYTALLWTTAVGKIALVVSGLWMLVGILVMKKMISFDI
ncbi:type II secretion system F family protein [Methylobacterium sp. B4]|uniref:type II secretion system F family protein n=1 Tax=Methylobacterium sp. B4 TaxID=1938755 RepID=UPI000D769F84|nr:type II secretion system F family protein [Methylobacterium sp. B4]PXW57460.1 tight adherence protein B [Methylobacterium sp. B4]